MNWTGSVDYHLLEIFPFFSHQLFLATAAAAEMMTGVSVSLHN